MKSTKYVLFCLFITLFFANCNNKEENIEPEFKLSTADDLDENEYQIYSLVLNEKFTSSNSLVVKQKTSKSNSISADNKYYQSLKTGIQNFDGSILTNLAEKNNSTYNLDNKFTVPKKTICLISSEESLYIFNSKDINQGWSDFFEKYPNSNGMIDMSRVGFNSDKSQALVVVGHYYASLGAEGSLIYLIKENNSWKIINSIILWVS